MSKGFEQLEAPKPFNGDSKSRVSVSPKLFGELLARAKDDEQPTSSTVVARLEQKMWDELYARVKNSDESARLVMLMDHDDELRKASPALYLVASLNVGREEQRRQRWSRLRSVLQKPLRWFTSDPETQSASHASDLLAVMMEQAKSAPALADSLIMFTMGRDEMKQPKKNKPKRKPATDQAPPAVSKESGPVGEPTAIGTAPVAHCK